MHLAGLPLDAELGGGDLAVAVGQRLPRRPLRVVYRLERVALVNAFRSTLFEHLSHLVMLDLN